MKPFLAILLLGLMGCPTYESELSGTFHEVTDRDQFSGEATAIELFRFGDNVQALVRTYKKNADPFQSEARCVWSNSGPFVDQETTFEIPLIDPRERTTLRGAFDGPDRITLSFVDPNSNVAGEPIPFVRVNDVPLDICQTIPDTLMSANFDFEGNTFEADKFTFKNPVFAVVWLGVETIDIGSFTTFAKTQRQGPWTRLGEGNLTSDNHGLVGVLHFFLPPPDPVVLTSSGVTRYSIGHFVVVEDGKDDTGDFEFDVSSEPVVASAVQDGTRIGVSPDGTDNFGRAVLFVEDDLRDLDQALLDRMVGVEKVTDTEQHFFAVDIFGRGADIKQIHFLEGPASELNVKVTDQFLGDSQIQLPRLIPFTQ